MLTPNLSNQSQRIREEFFPDFAILYSDTQIRGTLNNGKYHFKIYKLLWHVYINISETEYDLLDSTPVCVASFGFSSEYESVIKEISSKINIEEIISIMGWSNCDWA
jgi:hypothetical protein